MAQQTSEPGQAGQQAQAMTVERLTEIAREHEHAVDMLWDAIPYEAVDRLTDHYKAAHSRLFDLLADNDRLHAALAAAEETSDHWARLAGSFEGELYMARAALAAAEAREAALVEVARQVAHAPEGVELVPVYVTPAAYKQARALLASLPAGEGKE